MISEQVLDQFEKDVSDYRAGLIPDDRFPAIRLQQGIYAQRQEGFHMVRSKIPGGQLKAEQLIGIAEAIEIYSQQGHDFASITTRQDIQFHYVRLEDLPDVVRHLAKYGITTREVSGNTVRNITACPLAGICTREHVDVRTHLDGAARHFLGNPLTQQLPRKFKISFSGCEADCAQGMSHDLGVIATHNAAGERGFKLVAFGGLGAKPFEASTLDEFVAEADLLPALEAVVTLHHRHSDRTKRSKSRIKFLVKKFGLERLTEMYREEFELIRTGFEKESPRGEWRESNDGPICEGGVVRKLTPQRQEGVYALPVQVRLGHISSRQLRGLAELLPALGLRELRTTQDQNLLIPNVPEQKIEALRSGLAELSLHEPATGEDVVACPGTTLCPLAIVSSPALGREIDGDRHGLRIRINGCQNSCAQSDTGDIGLFSQARRHFGKLVPSYTLQLGGDGLSRGGFGLDGPTIPSLRTPQAVRRLKETFVDDRNGAESFREWALRKGEFYFGELLADLAEVKEHEVAGLLHDLGASETFTVGKVGIGECAGAGIDPIALAEAEADIAYQRSSRGAFAYAGDLEEAHTCLSTIAALAVRAAASVASVENGDEDRLNPAVLQPSLPNRLDLISEAESLQSVLCGEAGDAAQHAELFDRVERWVKAVLIAAKERRSAAANPLGVALELPVAVSAN